MPTFSAFFSGIAGFGKYTAEEWNKNDVTIEYNGQQQKLDIDYQKYLEITKLTDGKSTTIKQQVKSEDGSISNITFTITKKGNEYNIIDNTGKQVEFKGITESSTEKGLFIGGIKGGWEGLQYWLGGKIGTGNFSKITENITKPFTKEAVKSAIRVGLDTLTGVVEVPFQTLINTFSEDMSLKEAFEASGGWEAVKIQALIASILSFGGEAFSFKNYVLNSQIDDAVSINQIDDAVEDVANRTDDLGIEIANTSQGMNSQQLYDLEFDGTLRQRIEAVGYDTSNMSFEDMKREFPDLYDEILDQRYKLHKQNPDKFGRDPLPTALSSDGTVYYPPKDGFKLDSNGEPIVTEVTLTEGTLMDRYGGESGRFLGLTDDSGNLASYEQRSLCWTEETNTMYNKYTVNEGKVINTQSLTNYVNNLPQEEFDKVLAYMSSEGVKPNYSPDGKLIIKVTAGEIAPAYGLPGGGQQLALPVSIEMLKKWGFIS